MYGASLKPEPSYSPISSIPSATRGGAPFAAASAWVSRSESCVVMSPETAREGGDASAAPLAALVRLRDVDVLLRVRVRDRVVREDVGRDGRVHGRGEVRVDERHRRPLRQLLAGELVELLASEAPVLLRCLVSHVLPPAPSCPA